MRFVCDATVGRLARYLRMLGFDAASVDDFSVRAGEEREKEMRWFITRKRLPAHAGQTVRILSDRVRDQLEELKRTVPLFPDESLILTRCLSCNEPLREATRQEAEPHIPEYVFHTQSRFKTCPRCKRVFWPGTHTDRMTAMIREVFP